MNTKSKWSIGSEVKSQSGDSFILLKRWRNETNSHYINEVKCIKCGSIFTTTRLNSCYCFECKKNNTRLSRIGNIYGIYEILSYEGSKILKSGETLYYKVRCIKCGNISIKTWNTIQKGRFGCENCYHLRKNEYQPPTLTSTKNSVKSFYKNGAKRRNLEWNLSDEDFSNLIFDKCFYCGAEPKEYNSDKFANHTNLPFKRNGIDRIDTSKGYSMENCVTCCETCNRMKLNYSQSDFINHIYKIKNYWDLKRSTTIPFGSTLQANGKGSGELLTDNAEDEEIV